MISKLKDIAILIIAAMFIVSPCINARLCSREQMPYCDTIRKIVFDTLPYYMPKPKDSIVIKYVTAKLPDTDDKEDDSPVNDDTVQSDSTDVIIPITQKIYTDDSTYKAYVSGYMTSLDSLLFFFKKEEVITNTVVHKKDRRLSVSAQIGYGLTLSSTPQFTPYIGIGISYRIFNF